MILVIGATGPTGAEAVRLLVERGVPVRALTRDQERAATLPALAGAEVVAGDSSRPETLAPVFEGAEKVYLVPPTLPDWGRAQRGLIEAARTAGVRHVVKLSVMGASADAPSMSLRFHWQGEQELERSGLAFTHVRPHSFFQNTLFDAPTIRAESRFYCCVGDARFPKVDTRDIAAVVVTALLDGVHEGRTYELTGPDVLTYREMAHTLTAVLGREIEYVDLANDAWGQLLVNSGLPDWLAAEFVALYGRGQYSESGRDRPTDSVERVTGRPPRSFEQFVRDYRDAFEPRVRGGQRSR